MSYRRIKAVTFLSSMVAKCRTLCFVTSILCYSAHAQIISTIAGNGTASYSGDGGQATAAELNSPQGVTIDAAGNLYIADYSNNRIRKINTSGIISTIAGNGTAGYSGDGGAATAAELNSPAKVVFDAVGNIYIADTYNQRIRKISISGIISTIAGNGTLGYSGDGGVATNAELYYPRGVAVDAESNIYIVDKNNNRIRMVTTSGIISTIAGNGTTGYSGDGAEATAAELNTPEDLTFDAVGNIYIADMSNNRIRMINTSGIISTIAGNGTGGFAGDGGIATISELDFPHNVAFDAIGNLYVADYNNSRIRKINTSGIISTIAGNGTAGYSGDGSTPTGAELNTPEGIAVASGGNIYIADAGNNRIRKVVPSPSSSINTYSPTILPNTICSGQSATVTIPGSQIGVVYCLVALTNTNIPIPGTTKPGTSNGLSFSTGVLTTGSTSSIKTFIVVAANSTDTIHMTPFVSVTVNPTPVVVINSETICATNSATVILTPTVTGVSATGNTYNWQPDSATTPSLTISQSVNTTTFHTVTVTSTLGCEGLATSTVAVHPPPLVNVMSLPTICAGSTTSLTASGANTYTWNTGAAGTTIITSPTVTTNYTVTGMSGGCTNTATTTINVNPIPMLTVNSDTICSGDSVLITAHGAMMYNWVPGSFLSDSIGASVLAYPSSNMIYVVTGTDTFGCKNIAASTITVAATNSSFCQHTSTSNVLQVHNAFSPNNDGLNDLFTIDNIGEFPNNHVYIYNRWGQLLWNKSNYNNTSVAWDGKSQDGAALYAGTYFYIIENVGPKTYKGWVELTK